MRRVIVLVSLLLAAPTAARAQGVTLNQYRAAPTVNDGFAIGRPVGLGHLGVGARLDVDYALEPLRVHDGSGGDEVLVEHQLGGQLGLAIGVFDRFVGSVRLPVSLVMTEAGGDGDDPVPSAAALGDVTLGARWVLYGEDPASVFAIALAGEATIPTAEAADEAQDLAGEAGPSFSPEVDAELRFAPVRISAELGVRFREATTHQRLQIGNELSWGVGVGVDIVEGLLDATLEGFGATPLDDFGAARRSPVELLLGARLRPGAGVVIGVAAGAGVGLGYGSPRFRALLNVGWAMDFGTPPAPREAAADPVVDERPIDDAVAPTDAERATETPVVTPATEASPTSAGPVVDFDYDQLDRDGDRIVDALDRCPLDREDYDEIQDEDGCPEEDADEDLVLDVSDRCPLTAGVENRRNRSCHGCPALACVSDEGTITITQMVEFETDSAVIVESSEAVLGAVASIVETNPQLTRIRIEGHTDDRSSDEHNLELSRSRAASVRAWLVARGVAAERLEAWGCGEAHPIQPNRSRRGRQANRRVEFHLLEPPSAGYTPREGCLRAE